jgi:adenosine deaminase
MENTEDLTAFIRALPKAELHLHLEGSLEPEMMFALAKRNKVDIPFRDVAAVRAAYEFSNLQDFLDIYYQGSKVLLHEPDFYDLTDAYLRRVHEDGVRHVEVFFDPQGHTDRGVPFEVVVNGIHRALKDASADFGITSKLILCFLRHLDEGSAFRTLKEAEPFLDRITGIGLDSSEVGFPPSNFARVFAKAGEMGLRKVAHAGEEGPPSYVHEALDILKIERIDHGNRALEDEALIQRIAQSRIALTVCPLSNLKLCVVPDLKQHPLKRMLDLGLRATVNSDDPAYFGGYVLDNYLETALALNLSQQDLITLARNSFLGSFLSEAEQKPHLEDIGAITAGLSY